MIALIYHAIPHSVKTAESRELGASSALNVGDQPRSHQRQHQEWLVFVGIGGLTRLWWQSCARLYTYQNYTITEGYSLRMRLRDRRSLPLPNLPRYSAFG